MPIGKLKRLFHLSQQRHLPNTRLVPDHNDKGYGFIEDAQGREVYFSHEVVKNRFGFDDLRKGQLLEYTLDNGSLPASYFRLGRHNEPGRRTKSGCMSRHAEQFRQRFVRNRTEQHRPETQFQRITR